MIRLSTRRRVRTRVRLETPLVERLESLQLLTAAAPAVFHPMFVLDPTAATSGPSSSAYTPSQISQAYGFSSISFNGVKGNGAGQTIAIVDAYDAPTIQSDLNTFDSQFGLPATTVTRVNETGQTTYPATDPTGGWETEEALDVEWAHAIAPAASILLVEASSASDADLLAGVGYAEDNANVVSMSWGSGEFSGETGAGYDGTFVHKGVAFVASSGDQGAPASWPAASPNVLAVGGTALSLNSNGSYGGESGWTGSGGGPSAYESQPSYQSGVVTQTTMRANPDVAYDAAPETGFAVYDSFAGNTGSAPGWIQVGGTSAGAPQWAALIAIADQGRAANGLAALNTVGPQDVMTALYQQAGTGDFHDVTTGGSTGSPGYSAGPGYDYVTGLGTPVANLVVQSLDGGPTTTAPTPDTLTLAGSTTDTAGVATSVTLKALSSKRATDSAYVGTVHFSSSDVAAGLPANYTFTTADAGSHTFTLTFQTAGSQSVTASDTTTGASTATLSGISVDPAAVTNLTATAVSSSQIKVAWTGSAGATGYQVSRSLNGSAWTVVGTVGGGVTTYTDSGLSASTTYTYRVVATGGGLSSTGNASTSATTQAPPTTTGGGGGTSSTTDSLFSTTTTPPENAYAYGTYDLGVKFRSDVAGTVTGVRFYKQTWMGGVTHVGYLWSSTGTLLASATFTGETSYGWESVKFSNPVTIAANTYYIASFSSGGTYFGITTNGFSSTGVNNGPLHAPANSAVAGGNGVYGYGNSAFPSTSGSGMNFWADVTFSPTTTSATAATTKTPATPVKSSSSSASSAYVLTGGSSSGTGSTSSVSQDSGSSQWDWSVRRSIFQAFRPTVRF